MKNIPLSIAIPFALGLVVVITLIYLIYWLRIRKLMKPTMTVPLNPPVDNLDRPKVTDVVSSINSAGTKDKKTAKPLDSLGVVTPTAGSSNPAIIPASTGHVRSLKIFKKKKVDKQPSATAPTTTSVPLPKGTKIHVG